MCCLHIGPAKVSLIISMLGQGGVFEEEVVYTGNRRFTMTGNDNASIADIVRYFQVQVPRVIQIVLEQKRPGERLLKMILLLTTPEDDKYLYDEPLLDAMQPMTADLLMQPPGQLRRVSNNSRPPNSVPFRAGGRNYFNAQANFNRAWANR
jgi:hypothetical protein